MNKREQKDFVRAILAEATKRILAALDASPFSTEGWDGHELRQLVAEHVAWSALGNLAEVKYRRSAGGATSSRSLRKRVQVFRERHNL